MVIIILLLFIMTGCTKGYLVKECNNNGLPPETPCMAECRPKADQPTRYSIIIRGMDEKVYCEPIDKK